MPNEIHAEPGGRATFISVLFGLFAGILATFMYHENIYSIFGACTGFFLGFLFDAKQNKDVNYFNNS